VTGAGERTVIVIPVSESNSTPAETGYGHGV
jgi:hypothetical protein